MNNRTRYLTWALAALMGIGCIALIAFLSFQQGRRYAEARSAIKLADEEALWSLHALKALQGHTNTESRRFFEGRLNAAVAKLAEACTNQLSLIEPSQHLVLLQVRDLLRRGASGEDGGFEVRNNDALVARVDDAIGAIQSRLMERDWKEAQQHSNE